MNGEKLKRGETCLHGSESATSAKFCVKLLKTEKPPWLLAFRE
jgi:hypothetical protein